MNYVNSVYHVIHYRHVSTAVTVNFRVIYKIIKLICINEQLAVTKLVSDFLHSH